MIRESVFSGSTNRWKRSNISHNFVTWVWGSERRYDGVTSRRWRVVIFFNSLSILLRLSAKEETEGVFVCRRGLVGLLLQHVAVIELSTSWGQLSSRQELPPGCSARTLSVGNRLRSTNEESRRRWGYGRPEVQLYAKTSMNFSSVSVLQM